MHVDINVLVIIGSGFVIAFVYLMTKPQESVKIKSFECLEILSEHEWLEVYDIRVALERKHHGPVAAEDVRSNLEMLVADGLAQKRWTGKESVTGNLSRKIYAFRRHVDLNRRMGLPRLNTGRPQVPRLII
jgi:hypothetical protein